MQQIDLPKNFKGGIHIHRVENTVRYLFTLEQTNLPLLDLTLVDYSKTDRIFDRLLTDKLKKGKVEEMWQVNNPEIGFTHIVKSRNPTGTYTISLIDASKPIDPILFARSDSGDLSLDSNVFDKFKHFSDSDFYNAHYVDMESRSYSSFNPLIESNVTNPKLALSLLLMSTIFDAARNGNFVFINTITPEDDMVEEVIEVVVGKKKYEFIDGSLKGTVIDPNELGLFKENLSY